MGAISPSERETYIYNIASGPQDLFFIPAKFNEQNSRSITLRKNPSTLVAGSVLPSRPLHRLIHYNRQVAPRIPPSLALTIAAMNLEQFLLDWSYTGVTIFMWGTGMGFPVPEDVILLLSGWICAKEAASLWIMLPLVYFSILGADIFIYWLGLRLGHHVPKLPFIRTMLSEKKLAMAEAAFHKHGSKTVFITRLTPLIRAPIYFTAGAFKFPFHKFVFYDATAALIGTPIVVMVGYLGANQIEKMKEYSHGVQIAIFCVVATVVAAMVFLHMRQSKKLEAAAAQLEPILHHHVKKEASKKEDLNHK